MDKTNLKCDFIQNQVINIIGSHLEILITHPRVLFSGKLGFDKNVV